LLALDLIGTFVFGVEGATAAIHSQLDLFGIMVLAFAVALGGGIIRDLLIGDIPPGAIRDWRYAAIAFVAALFTFVWHQYVSHFPPGVLMVIDAAGLSLFAIAGASKALEFNIHPFFAVLMGAITGVGGGTIRDILLARIPLVLRADVYAAAALAGAAVMIILLKLKTSPALASAVGAAVCFLLRVVSVWRGWNLPRVMTT
jgi:uncharacterized membrane protein YeiH